MRKGKIFFASVLCFVILISCPDKILSQVFSNLGKDFWVGHMGHIDGAGSNFKLYISSTVNTSGVVSVPLQGWSMPFTITANTFTIIQVPSATAYVGCSDCIQQKGIHITSNDSVAAYAHIYASARSDATLLLPTQVLGKEYYAMCFTQEGSEKSEFLIAASDDSSKVEITPTANTLGGHAANVPFVVTLQRGEVYQVQSHTDLTGSKILALNTDSCKKLAVFAGSTWTSLGCGGASSGDNLYEQMYPPNTWGKNFVTSPFKTRVGDMFRVMARSNGTTVTINGAAVSLNQTQYFDTLLIVPAYISADKPITLAQYARTQNCDGNLGDPLMIILSPVEQAINNVLLYSSPEQNITGEYINAVMKTADIGSFLLDGAPVVFNPVPANPLYSYSQSTVAVGSHTLAADSGFNSIAYGFGSIESYGYLGGTRIRNLQQQTMAVNPQPACNGDTISFAGDASDVPTSWKWYFGDTATAYQKNTKHVYADSGTYIVSLVTAYADGCLSQQDSIFKTIHISGKPVVNFTSPEVCLGKPMVFTDSSTLPQGGALSSWKWNFGDGNYSVLQNISHTYAVCDTFRVKLIALSNNGCKDSTQKTVRVNCLPRANFSASSVCRNQSTVFADSSTGSIVSRSWYFGDNSAVNTSINPSYMYANSGTYNVKLVVTSSSGCLDSITKPVKVYYNPVVGFTYSNVCFGDSMHFINTSTVDTSSSIIHNLWVFGDGSASSILQSPSHYYTASGTYAVILAATTINGCSNAFTASVQTFDRPVSAFTFPNACLTDSASFTNTSLSPSMGTISNWSWNFGDASGLNTTAWSPNHLYGAPGTYNITLITHSSNLGCADTLHDSIVVYPMPVPNFSFSNVCLEQVMNFYDSSIVSSGSIAGRIWNFGDGSPSGLVQNPNHTYSSPGTYAVKLTALSNHGCKDSILKNSVVHPLPSAQFSRLDVCDGSSVHFTDLSSILATDTIHTHIWDFGDASAVSTGQNEAHLYSSWGTDTVKLLIVSSFGCRDSISKIVTVNPNPVVKFTAVDTIGCEPLFVSFQNLSSIPAGDNAGKIWDFGDGSPAASAANPIHSYSNDSLSVTKFYSVTLTVTSDSGCVSSLTKHFFITVFPKPAAVFTAQPQTTLITNPVISIVDLSAGGSYWHWNFGDQDTSSVFSPLPHTYADTGTYTITLITSTHYGCSDTAYQTVVIEPDFLFYIPNSFTPDGDGINDSFTGKGIFIREYSMSIFDRWGNLIFFTDDITKPWDGKANHGTETSQRDVYVYSISVTDFKNKKHSYKGTVTLVR